MKNGTKIREYVARNIPLGRICTYHEKKYTERDLYERDKCISG